MVQRDWACLVSNVGEVVKVLDTRSDAAKVVETRSTPNAVSLFAKAEGG